MKVINYILLLTIAVGLGCKKEEPFSEVPAIEFISMSPVTTVEFQNQVTITIKYQDGDGDLGTDDPDATSIYVKDRRLPAADEYHLQPLSPPDQKLQIQGELDIVLTGLFVIDTNQSEQTTFKIKLVDQAGNVSNEIETPVLTITKAS